MEETDPEENPAGAREDARDQRSHMREPGELPAAARAGHGAGSASAKIAFKRAPSSRSRYQTATGRVALTSRTIKPKCSNFPSFSANTLLLIPLSRL
jgi:hypothetical protein